MEEKTKVISKNAQQRMFHQDNMQNTRMEEEVVTLLQTFEEKKIQEETAGTEKINVEKVKLNDAIAEAKKSEASIREEASAKIQKLRAENSLEVQRVVSRKVRFSPCFLLAEGMQTATVALIISFPLSCPFLKEEAIAKTRAEAEKEASRLQAATGLEVRRELAGASLTAARNRADASRVLSCAEGVVAPYLAMKNAHTTDLKQMDICRSLASSRNLVLCDGHDDGANLAVVADSILADAARSGHLGRSAVLAQLSLVHRGSSGLFLRTDSMP